METFKEVSLSNLSKGCAYSLHATNLRLIKDFKGFLVGSGNFSIDRKDLKRSLYFFLAYASAILVSWANFDQKLNCFWIGYYSEFGVSIWAN